jgi:hypothetical protein
VVSGQEKALLFAVLLFFVRMDAGAFWVLAGRIN